MSKSNVAISRLKNKEIELTAQSNELTLAKINFSNIYQKRIMYAIVDSVSPLLKDKIQISKGEKPLHISHQKGAFAIDEFKYNAKDLEPNNRYYSHLRAALKELRNTNVTITTIDGAEIGTSLLLKYKFEPHSEVITMGIDTELYEFLMQLSKGYTLFNLKTALDLPSIYSTNIYELLAKWRNKPKFYISIEELRFATNTENKYKQIGEFKKNVLDVAKTQLNESKLTDLTFNYKDVKEGRKVIGFNIYVNRTARSHEVQDQTIKEVSPNWFMPDEALKLFKEMGMDLQGETKEIILTFFKSRSREEALSFVKRAYEKTEKKQANNVAGYVFSAIRNELTGKPTKRAEADENVPDPIKNLAKSLTVTEPPSNDGKKNK